MTVLIQREPVLNRHKTITASRLRVHAASVEAAAAELARLAEAWPESRDVFVSFVDPAMADTLLYWQPPMNVMLEIKADKLNDAATVALIADVVGRQVAAVLSSPARGGLSFGGKLRLPLSHHGFLIDFSTHRTRTIIM